MQDPAQRSGRRSRIRDCCCGHSRGARFCWCRRRPRECVVGVSFDEYAGLSERVRASARGLELEIRVEDDEGDPCCLDEDDHHEGESGNDCGGAACKEGGDEVR